MHANTLVGQLRILGFTFSTQDAAGVFAARCRLAQRRVWHAQNTVAVVIPTIDVEADVCLLAATFGGTPAG